MSDAAIISDRGGTLTTVVRRPNGGVSINQGHAYVNLSAEELQRLMDFTRESRPPATTPAKARLGELLAYPVVKRIG
jgi:hypothetical protein